LTGRDSAVVPLPAATTYPPGRTVPEGVGR